MDKAALLASAMAVMPAARMVMVGGGAARMASSPQEGLVGGATVGLEMEAVVGGATVDSEMAAVVAAAAWAAEAMAAVVAAQLEGASLHQ